MEAIWQGLGNLRRMKKRMVPLDAPLLPRSPGVLTLRFVAASEPGLEPGLDRLLGPHDLERAHVHHQGRESRSGGP